MEAARSAAIDRRRRVLTTSASTNGGLTESCIPCPACTRPVPCCSRPGPARPLPAAGPFGLPGASSLRSEGSEIRAANLPTVPVRHALGRESPTTDSRASWRRKGPQHDREGNEAETCRSPGQRRSLRSPLDICLTLPARWSAERMRRTRSAKSTVRLFPPHNRLLRDGDTR